MGITSGPALERSNLELRMTSAGIGWTPRWQTLTITDLALLGLVPTRACNTAPPLCQLTPPMMFAIVPTWSDADFRAFAKVMTSGTDAQQRDAINEMSDAYFASH